MKIKSNLGKVLMALFFVSTMVLSCDSSDNESIEVNMTDEEILSLVEIENLTDEVDNIVDDFLATEILASKATVEKVQGIDCRTKTIVINGQTKSVTLDFGDGCEMPNGNILSGKIVMNMELDLTASSVTITTTYDNFFVNGNGISGEKVTVRLRSNANGNPQSTVTYEIVVTWPDGETCTKEGTKIREWIAGRDTRTMKDNVYLITGAWEATFRDGTKLEATVEEELRREMNCKYLVSGSLAVEKGDSKGTLDFGDGTCDNIATFTDDAGVVTEIELKGRRKG